MLEKLLSGPSLMFLGVLIGSVILMRAAHMKSRDSRNRDVAQELPTELRAKQRSADSRIPQMEIRRHDYDRDVADRVQTTMRMLDQWIAEADREIVRLETLLEDCPMEPGSPLTAEQRRMVVHLAGAGYSISEIARLIDRQAEVVAQVLEDDQTPRQQAA